MARGLLILMPAALALSLAGGCMGTAHTLPYAKEVVWPAAMSETVVWRPDSIDEQGHVIRARRANLSGRVLEFELQLNDYWDVWTSRMITLITVRIEELQPKRVRHPDVEREMIMRIRNDLAYVPEAKP